MASNKKIKTKFETHILSKDDLTKLAAIRAADHVENYMFRKKNDIVESSEMRWCFENRKKEYQNSQSQWMDRNSIMAAPHGSEMYLQTDGDPATVLGSTRYYFDELSSNNQVDAKSKFPYSHDAQFAAKILTQVYRKRLQLRQFSAVQMQRVYRGFVTRTEVSAHIVTRNHARVVIYRFCKKCLRKLHRIKRRELVIRNRARTIQRLGRRFLKNKQAHMVDEIRVYLIVKRIQRFLRKRLKERRIARGVLRRLNLHATRLAAWVRGCLGRMHVHAIHSARFYIMYYYRRYFKRRHTHFVTNVQRLYRSYKLVEAVKCIQGNTRMFLIRRKYIKNHMECAARERRRFTTETELLMATVHRNMLANQDSKTTILNHWPWWDATILSPDDELIEQSRRKAKEDAALEAAAIAAEERNKNPPASLAPVQEKSPQLVPDFLPDFPRGRTQIVFMQEEFASMTRRCNDILFTEGLQRGEFPHSALADEEDELIRLDEYAIIGRATGSGTDKDIIKDKDKTKGKGISKDNPSINKGSAAGSKRAMSPNPVTAGKTVAPKTTTKITSATSRHTGDNKSRPSSGSKSRPSSDSKSRPSSGSKSRPSSDSKSRPSSGSKSRPSSDSKSRPSSGSNNKAKTKDGKGAKGKVKPGTRGKSPPRGTKGKTAKATKVVEVAEEVQLEEDEGPFVTPLVQLATFEDKITLAILHAFAAKDNNTVIDHIALQYLLRCGYLHVRSCEPHPPFQFPLYEAKSKPKLKPPEVEEVEGTWNVDLEVNANANADADTDTDEVILNTDTNANPTDAEPGSDPDPDPNAHDSVVVNVNSVKLAAAPVSSAVKAPPSSSEVKEIRFPENPDPSESVSGAKNRHKIHHNGHHQGLSMVTYELMNQYAITAAVSPNDVRAAQAEHDHPQVCVPSTKSDFFDPNKGKDTEGEADNKDLNPHSGLFNKIIDSVRHTGVIEISGLVTVLKPSRSIYFRVVVRRSLPHFLLIQALFVRLWTYHLSNQLFDALTCFRLSNRPRYCCQRCLQPFTFRTEMVHHKPEQCYHPFSHWRWLNHAHLSRNEKLIEQLVRYVQRITDFPPCFAELKATIKREEKEEAMAALLAAEKAQSMTKGKSGKSGGKDAGSSKSGSKKAGSSKSSAKGKSGKEKEKNNSSTKIPGKAASSKDKKKITSEKPSKSKKI